jgi:D-alanine-D-alanine ligase
MKIGITYNLVEKTDKRYKLDSLSDNEIAGTVALVEKALRLKTDSEVVPYRVTKKSLPRLHRQGFDFVFNLCEGLGGDMTGEPLIPALLDSHKIPYTGSGSETLKLCNNKADTKKLLIENNIKTPRYYVFDSLKKARSLLMDNPLIVKPVEEDAGVGITNDAVVHDKKALLARLDYIFKTFDEPALVEEYIEGREINAALIGNNSTLSVLPLSEIIFTDWDERQPRIVSYGAKWEAGSEAYRKTPGVCPAEMDKDLEARLKHIAAASAKLAGCRDYSRVDFRVKGDEPYVIEINPNPGINLDSGFFRSAKAAGMSYDDLVIRILNEAQKRYQ